MKTIFDSSICSIELQQVVCMYALLDILSFMYHIVTEVWQLSQKRTLEQKRHCLVSLLQRHLHFHNRIIGQSRLAIGALQISVWITSKTQESQILLFYRPTPLANGYSQAELLMGRKLCSTILCYQKCTSQIFHHIPRHSSQNNYTGQNNRKTSTDITEHPNGKLYRPVIKFAFLNVVLMLAAGNSISQIAHHHFWCFL